MSASPPSNPSLIARVASVDVYRGFVMFLMLASVLRLALIAKALPDSQLWQFLALQQSHVEWRGCTLHDLIQPSFSFLVGVALPFSIAARRLRRQSLWFTTLHAIWRASLLIFLGIFLRSVDRPRTNFTFEDTLTQIGLGYVFLFALGHVRVLWQWIALAIILLGYWGAFALWPLPGPEFDYQAVDGLTEAERPTGFAAHWDKNTNLAWAFDRWFLNQFPRVKYSQEKDEKGDTVTQIRPNPFTHNRGGYATLSFIPTLGTMILGLLAGGWMRLPTSQWAKIRRFVLLGVVLVAAGWGLDAAGICPSVKKIWTPAWVLFSGGWCFLLLALFSSLLDTGLPGGWAYPLKVIGANSIVAYVGSHLIEEFLLASFKTHLGSHAFDWAEELAPLARGLLVLAIYWLILFWMYQRKVFVKI